MEEVFNELLFGSGAWIGLILVIGICLLISSRIKYSGSIFMLILIFLSFEYWGRITATSMHAWFVIICLLGVLFHGFILYGDLRKK